MFGFPWFHGSVSTSNSRYLVCATAPTALCRTFWNFKGVFVMVWKCECGLDVILRLICVTFLAFLTCHFTGANTIQRYRQWVPCVRNSSYSCMPILLKLYRCSVIVRRCACGLNIILRLICITFICILNLVIFQPWILLKYIDTCSGYFVSATPPAVLCQSFSKFTGVFVMVWRYACGLDIILRSFFLLIVHIAKNYGYFVCATPPAVLCQSFSKFTGVFVMVWRYAYASLDLFFIDSSHS